MATKSGRLDVMELLLQEGAPVNAKDTSNGQTALHVAAGIGLLDSVQLLCGVWMCTILLVPESRLQELGLRSV